MFPVAVILAILKVAPCCCCCLLHACLFSSFSFFFTAVTWNQPWRECIVWNTQKDLNVKGSFGKDASNLFWNCCCFRYMFDTQQWNGMPSPGPAVFRAYLHLSYNKRSATITDCLNGMKNRKKSHAFLHYNVSSGPKIMDRPQRLQYFVFVYLFFLKLTKYKLMWTVAFCLAHF